MTFDLFTHDSLLIVTLIYDPWQEISIKYVALNTFVHLLGLLTPKASTSAQCQYVLSLLAQYIKSEQHLLAIESFL